MTDQNCVLITGQQWVDLHYFEIHYAPVIQEAFAAGRSFGLGAGEGVDKLAQELLARLCGLDDTAYARVTVYDKGAKDGRVDKRFRLSNGYESYPKRDVAMAIACGAKPIAVLAQYGSAATGSQLPLLVRHLMSSPVCAWSGQTLEAVVELATSIHEMQRKHCEPWNEATLGAVKQMYERIYNEE